jgi:HEPN domain-containing protein
MAELTPLVEAWIRYAEDDWHDSQILANAGGNKRSICFHLQQCIEKLFKAELMRLEVPVPKTHNLRELSELLEQADAGWSAASIDLNRLSLAAVDFRYPDPSEPELDIGLPLIQSIAADLRVRLLDRLGGGR